MTELSEEVAARSRKIQATILHRFAQMKYTHVARQAAVHETTIGRFVGSEDLAKICVYLSAAGLQVVPADSQVISRRELRVLKEMSLKYLEADLAHDEIVDAQLESLRNE